MRHRFVAQTLAVLALLTACGSERVASSGAEGDRGRKSTSVPTEPTPSSPGPPTPRPSATAFDVSSLEPERYSFRYRGAVVTVEVPMRLDRPRVAKLEKARKAAGARPNSYYGVTVDNTRGGHLFSLYEVSVHTDRGSWVTASDSGTDMLRYWQSGEGIDVPPLWEVEPGRTERDIYLTEYSPLDGRPAEVIITVDSTVELVGARM